MKPYELLRRTEALAAALALTGVVGLVAWATVTRYIGQPNIWVLEVTQVLFAWTCLLAASVAFRRSSHFSVSVLEDMLPDRLRHPLRLIQQGLMLALLLALGWVALDYVAVAHRRPLPLTGIRFSWVAAAMPVTCGLMALTCVANLTRLIRHPGASDDTETETTQC